MEDIIKRAIAKYGADAQCDKAIEELSELIKAILKHRYAKAGAEKEICLDAISEEMADVEIMLAQLRLIFGNDSKIEEYKVKKIERLERRLNGLLRL